MTTSSASTPAIAEGIDLAKMPGHWVLARMGKRILRPGGLELTNKMLAGLNITRDDDVVEFAPGLGETTRLILACQPRSYVAIERDEQAAEGITALVGPAGHRCVQGTAQKTGLEDASATVVLGEAYLSMQSSEQKQKIADEAFRILKPGGRFGLHELLLRPDGLDEATQERVRGELTRAIHVGARPCTSEDWRGFLETAGFEITNEHDLVMGLLHPKRVLDDEGLRRTAKIVFNVARNPAARSRILGMRKTFTTNADNLGALTLVARKPS